MNISEPVALLIGRSVELVDTLSEDGRRNSVVRLRVTSGAEDGRTVIAKQTAGFHDAETSDEVRLRFFREAAAATLLTELAPGEHTPRCWGVDPRNGLMIFDDLGTAATLVQPLLEGSPGAARSAMISFVQRLASIHAATARRSADWDRTVTALGAPAALLTERVLARYGHAVDAGLGGLDRLLADLDLPPVQDRLELLVELESVKQTLTRPGPFTVLVHNDPCPDNVVITSSGARLLDFEFGRPGHALIDGLYPQLPFPSCWCCNAVPDDFGAELAQLYRNGLEDGIPEAADDDLYAEATAHVTAYWLLMSFEWIAEDVLTQSRTWGIASTRSRVLSRLDSFIRVADATDRLPRLAGLARQLRAVSADRWTGVDPLPVYPGFGVAASN
ncbi:phosphotransferase [Microlunatus sp. Gsoil 973]|uniref:phosphotransferase n=1 Tax=Microlunatus sp. Gsoil 973 TaxID=2672569 RepID=UPI0018A85CE5|nr:phosphotransferase [Microlunatus sp. Gsoil 973]